MEGTTIMDRDNRLLLVTGLGLATLVIAAIAFISKFSLTAELLHVIMLLLGMISVEAINLIISSSETRMKKSFAITFNEDFASARIKNVQGRVIDVEVINSPIERWQHRGGISPATLVGCDNNLALAKLRMDLDEALLECASLHNIEGAYELHANQLFDQMVSRGVFTRELFSVWREVVSACNKAIHGGSVDDNTARSLIRVGYQLMAAFFVTGKKEEQER